MQRLVTTALLVSLMAGSAAMSAPRAEVDARDQGQSGHWKRGGEPQPRDAGNATGSGRDSGERSAPRQPREPQARPGGQPVHPAQPDQPTRPVEPARPIQPAGPSNGPLIGRPQWRGNDRPEPNRDRDQRTWDRNPRTWDRDRADRNSNRDRSWGSNRWRDDRGREWRHERSWYDRYRLDHFHFYGGRYIARQRFFLGYYYLPFAYAPRVWVIGDWLPSAYFYDGRYFVDDYWRFNLYDPPYGCRWLRVRSDALLIDIGTGEVLDVVYDLYW